MSKTSELREMLSSRTEWSVITPEELQQLAIEVGVTYEYAVKVANGHGLHIWTNPAPCVHGARVPR